ncbi:hypothetical protein J4233_05645 [Candidatus Pacearchaeota archaeon]|nr:hypothetical protein [uncultured archaeon]MBS3077720.1 hypothetical protein [Candidatus Pacearchaeota archaeon]
MKKETLNRVWIVTFFAIAMGYLEAIVVAYLRALYYPNGFNFPLANLVQSEILLIEWVREFATIVMLVTVAMLAGKKFFERSAYFIFAFAVWDIFYYVFLKVILDWPASLFTWDVLFLIPWPWVGPVITPVLCSLLMIFTAIAVLNLNDKGKKIRTILYDWIIIILGILLVLISWMYDYGKMIFLNNSDSGFVPTHYNWWLFGIGFILAGFGIARFLIRNKK